MPASSTLRRAVVVLSALLLGTGEQVRCASASPAPPVPSLEASFDHGDGDRPAGWAEHVWQGSGGFAWDDGGRDGGRCLRIDSIEGGDLSWQTQIALEPHAVYRLSGWIRTSALDPGSGTGALLNVHELPDARTAAVVGTTGWTRVEVEFRTRSAGVATVNCLFGGWGRSTGRAWFDDVQVQRIGVWSLDEPKIVIDAADVRDPLPLEIYGQFIEHLGRCIQGGIWAEMLEDRKFLFPVVEPCEPYRGLTETAYPVLGGSPWAIVGPASSVTMVEEDAFVGAHAPRIAPGAAIQQRDLAVVQGRRYVGHAWLRSDGGVPARIQVALDGASGGAGFEVSPDEWTRHAFAFEASETRPSAAFTIAVEGAPCRVGCVSLMPADNVNGLRADTLAALKTLGATVYRWPGGNFVSGYDWRDGIGPRDRRPPRRNPAWTGIEMNDFGLDEFVAFCRTVDAEPLIVVNTGFGDAFSAAQEVEYCNGGTDTLAGGWRTANGHAEPYDVRWWGVGNEMYGAWQLGHMALDQYVLKHRLVAEAMRRADPAIRLVGVGAAGGWSERMLRDCGDAMDALSEHFYAQDRADVVAHVALVPQAIRGIVRFHRELRSRDPAIAARGVPVAMDEWNYWYGPQVYGELGTQYFLKDALGVAAGLHEFARSTDVVASAFYAQTVNVIGCVKTSRTDAALETTGLVLSLYRHRFGRIPVAVSSNLDPADLDVVAAWTDDRTALTIAIVNPQATAMHIGIEVKGATPSTATADRWTIASDDPLAFNEPGKPPRVAIAHDTTPVEEAIDVPPFSATLLRLPADGR